MEFAKKKGKEGTRGAKQIASENAATVQFYRNMILGANGIYFTGMTLQGATYGGFEITMFLIAAAISIASYQFLARAGTPTLSSDGQLVDPGVDLNMTDGLAEHVKDIIILNSFAQMLSLLSNYLWLLLLLLPLRAFWMLWRTVISPWLFAPAPEDDPAVAAADAKKQKKMERKMRRLR